MRRPTPTRLLDARGHPVIAYVERSTRLSERWLGRRVRLYTSVFYRGRRLYARARIQFVGSMKWYEARHVFAPPRLGEEPGIPILRALRTFSNEHWWISATAALERRATLYEERMSDPPPRAGWRLASIDEVEELVADRKKTTGPLPTSQTDRDLAARDDVRRHARRLARAITTLELHERALARQSRLVDKWRKRVASLRLTKSTRVVANLADEIETYDYNTLGALKTNAGVTLDDQRLKLVGGGTADAAVPNSYTNQPITLDPGGRVTSLFGNTLTYNKRGRLIGITHPPVNNVTNTEYYGYDAEMRRIGRFGVVNGVPSATDYELFVWDGPNLVASIDRTNHVNESFLYESIDQPLRISSSGLKYYYELDFAGNVRRLRRTDGSDGGGYRYTAFGQEQTHDAQAPTPAIAQMLRWKARWWSDFAQLYDVRARWWSPQIAIFTGIDGIAYHDTHSTLWGWAHQNPILRDPSGRDPVSAILGTIGVDSAGGGLGLSGFGGVPATIGLVTSVAAFGALTLAAGAIILPTTYVIMKDLDDYWHPCGFRKF